MKRFFEGKVQTSETAITQYDDLRIQLKDIKRATNNFHQSYLIGRARYGEIYKGELSLGQGVVNVVIKRFNNRFGPEFWNDVMLYSRYRHKNLVSLIGFCNEKDERILVYEFLARGSLDLYLSTTKLSWSMRLQICIGVARGLNFLHEFGQQITVHGNINSANILLGEDWEAKIDDSGLGKLGRNGQYFIDFSTTITGRKIGYLDPLYMQTGFLTKESDIYSFGVVLFEVLCGRLAVTRDVDGISYLIEMIEKHYEKGTLLDIIDPRLRGQMNKDSFNIYVAIAYQCVRTRREKRPPTAFVIIKELERSLWALQQNEVA